MPWRNQMADIPFEGIYRRQIDLQKWDANTVVGWLEDESHHFGVTLVHEGGIIRELRVAAPRHPWTTCPGAAEPLQALVGKPLVARCAAVGAMTDARLQCTHIFDLASLVVAHAHAGRDHRRYHGTVEPLSVHVADAPAGWLRTTLHCDGREVLAWDVHDDHIMAPPPYAGRTIYHGFREWTETLDAEAAEHALVLRRIAFVSNGRKIAIEHLASAAVMNQGPVCHTFQPTVSAKAIPITDSRRRYDNDAGDMLTLLDTRP